MTKCAIIKMNNIDKSRNKALNMDLSSELGKLLETTIDRIDKEIPDVGYFRDIVVKFDNDNKPKELFAKNIALIIERDAQNEGKGYLGVSALHPQMLKDSTIYIMNGSREELLNYLKKEDSKTEILGIVQELDDALKKIK